MSDLTSRKRKAAEQHIRRVLRIMGVDFKNDTAETPRRMVASLEEFTRTLRSPDITFKFTQFDAEGEDDNDQLVIAKDLRFSSMCSHHFLPFFGKAHIGYLPGKRVLGWSKMPRLVEHLSRRPQMQETLTKNIANYMMEHLEPQAVIVVISGTHTCSRCRGIKDPDGKMITSAIRGDKKFGIRDEFMELLRDNI